MASREYYSEVIDEMRKAQGKLTNALYSDLDRLAGAESNGTKVKVQEAYERGVNEAFEAIDALYRMSIEDTQYVFGTTNFHDIVKNENHLETLNKIHVFERVELGNEPKVGDEVDTEFGKGIIIQKCNGDILGVFLPKQISTANIKTHNVRKTGRRCNDVEKFLKMIEEMRKCS